MTMMEGMLGANDGDQLCRDNIDIIIGRAIAAGRVMKDLGQAGGGSAAGIRLRYHPRRVPPRLRRAIGTSDLVEHPVLLVNAWSARGCRMGGGANGARFEAPSGLPSCRSIVLAGR